MNKCVTLLSVLAVWPLCVNLAKAQSCTQSDCYTVRAMTGMGVGKQNQDAAWIGGGALQYTLNPYIDVGVGLSTLVSVDEDSFAPELYLSHDFPLGNRFSLFMDAGVRDKGAFWVLGYGGRYQYSPAWSFEVGYRYYAEPHSEEEGDLYSLQVGLRYALGVGRKVEVASSPKPRPVAPVTAPVIAEPEVVVLAPVLVPEPVVALPPPKVLPPEPVLELPATETAPRCRVTYTQVGAVSNTQSYTIAAGDWPAQIAREYCTTTKVLRQLNPWLDKRLAQRKYAHPGEKLVVPAPLK